MINELTCQQLDLVSGGDCMGSFTLAGAAIGGTIGAGAGFFGGFGFGAGPGFMGGLGIGTSLGAIGGAYFCYE
jgi:hypothetical protein